MFQSKNLSKMSVLAILLLVSGCFLQKLWWPHQQYGLGLMLYTAYMHLRDDWQRHTTGRYGLWCCFTFVFVLPSLIWLFLFLWVPLKVNICFHLVIEGNGGLVYQIILKLVCWFATSQSHFLEICNFKKVLRGERILCLSWYEQHSNDILLVFWQVAIKTLIVIHRTLREGDPIFKEELLNFQQKGRILQMSNFKDDSSPIGKYLMFLEVILHTFALRILTITQNVSEA